MQFGAEPDQGKKPNVNRALWGWQYTSTGRVPGINGNADLDICYQDPAGTDETGTESGTIWCLFSPILFCAVTEKKKPITRAVISFFRIYHVLQMSRSSRNRTHIDGFGDHCSTFELCSYHGPDRTDELYYSKLSRQKQVFFAKKVSGRLPFSQVCAFTAQTVRKRTGRKRVRNGVLPDPFRKRGGNVKFLKALCKKGFL